MIIFHWTRILYGGAALALGIVVGIAWRLPFEQASNLISFIVGLLIGLVGIAATFWVAAKDREMKIGEVRTSVDQTKELVVTLHELASQMWRPALSALVDRQPTNTGQI